MRLFLSLMAVAALAGCEAEESAANRATGTNVAVADVPEPPPVAEASAPVAKGLVPERFRGLWAENQQVCGVLTHGSRLVIGDDDLRFPDYILDIDEVSEPDANSFAIKAHNKKSGTRSEAHYSLDVTGNILTDEAGGGTVRVRCG